MTHFSLSPLIRNALSGHKNWKEQWPDGEPKSSYDVVIVGAGGHGLGAAYYLAKEHGITNVAVIEKEWVGGGNIGCNTTIIRSNYLYDESVRLYDHALDLWKGLSQEPNYNVMFSQRGVMMLAHTVHDVQSFQRHVHANRLNGVDNAWVSAEDAKRICLPLNISPDARCPVLGAALQRRAGTARTMPWLRGTPAPPRREASTDVEDKVRLEETYYSTGGGFVATASELDARQQGGGE